MQSIISDAALLSAFSPLAAFPSAALAVSGGPDSMALMDLISKWLGLTGRSPAEIVVLTVDHGLRRESAEEAEFTAGQAASLGFKHVTLKWTGAKPESGLQAAARRARYGLMTEYCRAHHIACLVTAHTGDDQAETLLMRLRRGSGVDGLGAMSLISDRDGVPLLRPLLGMSKARLIAHLDGRNLLYMSDPSNANVSFERVRLRHAMRAASAAGLSKPALVLAASRLARARDALAQISNQFLEREFRVTTLAEGTAALDAFNDLPAEIALRVLSQILMLIGGKDQPPQLAKAERLFSELRSGKQEMALGGCLIISGGSSLQVLREPGRMQRAAQPAEPGSACIWDGRFVLTLAPSLDRDVTIAPLGPKGWELWRKALKEKKVLYNPNRLAAISSPALWKDGQLLAAPSLGFLYPELTNASNPPARAALVPRLGHFLKPV